MLPVNALEASVRGNALLNIKAQTFDLTEASASIANIPLSGELHGTGVLESPSFLVSLSVRNSTRRRC